MAQNLESHCFCVHEMCLTEGERSHVLLMQKVVGWACPRNVRSNVTRKVLVLC